MHLEMPKTQQSRTNMLSKRQGIVYNGDEQTSQFDGLPTSLVRGYNYSAGQNGESSASNLMKYGKDDETRKSTGSISNFGPTQGYFHVRSSSDTSEIMSMAPYDTRMNDDQNNERPERPNSGDSFHAIIQRFENASFQGQLGQRLNNLTTKKGNDRTDWGGSSKVFKSPMTSGTASPISDKKTYLNLKRKGSLKASAARKGKSDERGPVDERNWEKPRKAFAHYDVQSAAFDFEIIANNISKNGDCLRRKNTITGASAASGRETAAVIADKTQACETTCGTGEGKEEQGDSKTNELVLSCPYFRNELGGEQDEIFGEFRYNSSYKTLNGQRSLNKRHSTLDVVLTAYDSIRRGQVFSATGVTILDSHMAHGEVNEPADLCSIEDRKMFEHVDHGAFYYRHHFLGQDHVNYVGEDEKFGAIAISYKRVKTIVPHPHDEEGNIIHYEYQVIVRTSEMETLRGSVLEECIPSTSRHGTARGLPPKDIFEYVCPELNLNSLKLATAGPKVPEILLKLDEQGVTRQHKIGILYCKAGQSTEEEMYNNEEAGPAFNEFMDLIGDRVVLKGFEGYRAQLDNRNDSTGVYSLYRTFRGREVMFHVSTMLPWTSNNRQQLLRKRHIGNDIVTIVFQEPGALQFTPKNIRSHFQHVFILVRVFDPCTANTRYQVAVSRSKDVPAFGPPIPAGGIFTNKEGFSTFLITKLINAENAAHKSDKFRAMAVRTRHEYLKDLVTNYTTNTTVETGAKFGKFLGSKKKEKSHPNISPEVLSKGGLSWDVEVEDNRNMTMIKCFLVLSLDSFVLIDVSTREAIFYIPCKAIIGWTPMSKKLKIFHGAGDCLVFSLPSPEDIPSIISRLGIVTTGHQTQAMTLRRHNNGQLGFNVHNEGMVVEVEQDGLAQVAGLKQNSRLVEIFGKPVAMMAYKEMVAELCRPSNVPVVVIPPYPSGKPRKGVQLAAVNYNSPSEALSTFSTSRSQQSLDRSPHSSIHESESLNYSNSSTIKLVDSTMELPKDADETKANGVPWIRRPGSPANSDDKYSEHDSSVRSANSQERNTSSYGISYTLTGKRTGNQPNGGETVLSMKYIPRPDPSTPKTSDSRRNDEYKNPESQTRTFLFTRTPPKVTDKRAAADILQSKLSAHARSDSSHPRNYHRAPPYPGPKPLRPPEYTPHDERRALNQYKPETAKKPTGLEGLHPRLEIIHSRSKSEPWDPGNTQDGLRRSYKETTLGPHITTVETFRENYDTAMSDTVDQIEKAFGGPSATHADRSPSTQGTRKGRRPPAIPRPVDSESYLSSTSNESLATSDSERGVVTYSDSERERSSGGQKKPVSSKRLVSKKIGVRAEITSTTAKSPGAIDTYSTREVGSPSIQSSTTVFVRSKSNEPPVENTGSLKRTPRSHSNTLPRTVNREEVTISRENPGANTPRKRQGLIRELSQNDNAYVYSPRPFHSRGASQEAEAFQFPDPDTRRIRDEKPKIVSQTKICLLSPTGSTTQLSGESSTQGSARSTRAPPEKDARGNKVPYFVKRRDHAGITPELVDERISKIAEKNRTKSSPDTGRRPSREGQEKEPLALSKRTAGDGAQTKQYDSQSSLNKENKGDQLLNEVSYLLSATDAMSRDASTTLAHTEQMLASWGKVLSETKEEKGNGRKMTHSNTTSSLRTRLPSGMFRRGFIHSEHLHGNIPLVHICQKEKVAVEILAKTTDGTPITVSLGLRKAAMNPTPRRHSFDDKMLTLLDSPFESKESLASSRQTLSSKDGFHRIVELETKVTELSFFLQKEREQNIELMRKLKKLEEGHPSRR